MCCISDVPSRSRQSVEREVLSLAAAQMMPFPLMAALVGRVNFADKGSAENSPRIKLSNCIRLCAATAAAGEKELSFTHTPLPWDELRSVQGCLNRLGQRRLGRI